MLKTKLNYRIFLGTLILVFGSLLSCTSKKNENSTNASTKLQEVNLAIWNNYLPEEVQKKFTEQTGIKINITNFSSNEELLAKIQMGSSGIDMAVPSDYMVDVMIKLGLLENINKQEIKHFGQISKDVLAQPYDPENAFSVPYAWTTTGIAINRDLYKGEIKGWKDLFEANSLSGKLALLDDAREVVGSALKVKGYSVNTVKAEEVAQAKELLMKVKKRVKMFASDTIDILKNKEVVAAQAYSVDALQARSQTNMKIDFIIPQEGSTRSIDNLVVFKSAKNKEQAKKLIDFITDPQNNLIFVTQIKAGPIFKETQNALPAELKNDTALFPAPATLEKLERIYDLGEKNKLYEDLWTQLKITN